MMKSLGKRYGDLKANKKKGFTLIELVVVIAIMAVLALIMVPSLTAYVERAETAKIHANLKNIHTAAEMVNQTEEDFTVTEVSRYSNIDVLEASAPDAYSAVISDGSAVVTYGTVNDGWVFDGKVFVKFPIETSD